MAQKRLCLILVLKNKSFGALNHSFILIAYELTISRRFVQPRSQGLSSLPSLVVGRKTLVAAGHMTTCDTNYSTGVESTDNFCRSQPAEAKERSSNLKLHL